MDQQGLPLPHHLSHIQPHLTPHRSTSPQEQLQHLLAWRIFDNILDNKHVYVRNAQGFNLYLLLVIVKFLHFIECQPYFSGY